MKIPTVPFLYELSAITNDSYDRKITNRLHSSAQFNPLTLLCRKNLEKSTVFWYYKNTKKVLKSYANYAIVKAHEINIMGVDG